MTLHAVAQCVPRQPQSRRSARDVASLDAQGVLDAAAFERCHLVVYALAHARGHRHARRARQTQGRRRHLLCFGKEGNPLHQVGQLAHVARPRV